MASRSPGTAGTQRAASLPSGRGARIYSFPKPARAKSLPRVSFGAAVGFALFASALATHLVLFRRAKRHLGF